MVGRSALLGAALLVVLAVTIGSAGRADVPAPDLALPIAHGAEHADARRTIPITLTAAEPKLPVLAPRPAKAELPYMKHLYQSLNNCGPASVVMALSSLGIDVDQETARLALRGTDVRRGMGPGPVDPWVKSNFGVRSLWRNNGTNELIKQLVANGFAPMVTQWMQDPTVSRVAHWRTVRGYDDAAEVFHVNDPMLGRVPLSYSWFSDNWQNFSYRYMVIYRPEDEAKLQAIVGDDWSDVKMRENLYRRLKAETGDRDDSASWLALGEAAYLWGEFDEAIFAFDRGMTLGSATGVFTLRSSYTRALTALGRVQEANTMQSILQATSASSTAAAPAEPDALALSLHRQRAALTALAKLPADAPQPLP